MKNKKIAIIVGLVVAVVATVVLVSPQLLPGKIFKSPSVSLQTHEIDTGQPVATPDLRISNVRYNEYATSTDGSYALMNVSFDVRSNIDVGAPLYLRVADAEFDAGSTAYYDIKFRLNGTYMSSGALWRTRSVADDTYYICVGIVGTSVTREAYSDLDNNCVEINASDF